MIEIKHWYSGAVLYRSDRAQAIREALEEAVQAGARLTGASLVRASLVRARLDGASLTGATGFRFLDAPDPLVLRRLVADQIEAHPELHRQSKWGTGEPDCKTGQCVAGWACSLGGGRRG